MAFKYIISNWIYGDEDLAVTFDRLQRFGYDGIELMGEPTQYDVQEVQSLMDKTGIKVMTLAGIYTADRDLSDPDPSVRANAIQYVKSCCDFANALGAEVVIVVPSEVTRTKPHNCNPLDETDWLRAFDEEWKTAVDSVHEVGLYAQTEGVVLAIEPANRYEVLLVNTAEQGMQMMNEVNLPSVKLHLDTFHMNIEDADPPAAIRRAGSALVNFHVADSNRQVVGEGHVDWKAHLAALREIGYERTLSLEPLPPVADTYLAANIQRYKPFRDEYAQRAIQRLKQIENALG